MKIAVFCSANSDIDAAYFKAAGELGRWIGSNGHTLVFTIIERGGKASPSMDVCIPCDNLSDRKELMMAQCDAAVALPGGLGTLDEVFTMAASATIGYHHKPILLLNVGGFWDSLVALLDDLKRKGMVRREWNDIIKVAATVDEAAGLLA